jgi:plasmid replication initiation protein
VDEQGRSLGLEFILPDWLYDGIINQQLVLSIDPAYFNLTSGIERWLYRVVRKHGGRQKTGWGSRRYQQKIFGKGDSDEITAGRQ